MSNYSDSSFLRDENSSWYKAYSMVTPGSKVLDVGCSIGTFGSVLIAEKQCTVHGIELDKKDFETAKTNLHKVFRLNVEHDALNELDNDYDFIYFGDVIEHLVTPEGSLRRMLPFLKDGGRLLFSVPNMTHLLVRLMLLEGKFEYGNTGLLDRTHLHYYDYDFLQRTLNEAGFEIETNDPMLKDLPEAVIAEQLAKVGLEPTKAFIDFTRTTHASVYQFVGAAKKITGKAPKLEPLRISSPVDVFQTYFDNTTKYYEDTIVNLKQQVKEVERAYKAEVRNRDRTIQELQGQLDRIVNSRGWKFLETARKVTRRKKG
ncbi:MAG TPA: class I SAM-dependent methyltransferase [Candidatus Saccharimonadales bacterium]|nr:class I SAM-dependent methyltransferase [Candidatus Saccharimonadales bacterium]